MRTRFTGVSIVMAVFGAAAVGLAQYPVHAIVVFGVRIYISAAVIVFGLSLLGTLFVLDYFYFYRMLLAVVRHAEEMEIASLSTGSSDNVRPYMLYFKCHLSETRRCCPVVVRRDPARVGAAIFALSRHAGYSERRL